MDEFLERAKKAVDKFHSKQASDKTKATKAVLSSVLSCKKFISENENNEGDVAQKAVKELSEIIGNTPPLKSFTTEPNALEAMNTREQAAEHLEMIQKHLETHIKDIEIAKRKKVRDWVRSHPILGKLRRSASKKLPEGAYVLLFRKSSVAANAKKHGHGKHRQEKQIDKSTEQTNTVSATLEHSQVSISSVNISIELAAAESLQTLASSTLMEGVRVSESFSESSVQLQSIEGNFTQCNKSESVTLAFNSGLIEASTVSVSTDTTSGAIADDQPDPELVLRPAPDGRIFTRFRPREFADETRIYRMFRGGPPIVGACIISQGKLTHSYGVLPRPRENGDQVRVLLSLSKEAVGRPGRAFVESHEVLGELFKMSKNRKIHKEAYVLLFELAEDEKTEQQEKGEAPAQEPGEHLSSDEQHDHEETHDHEEHSDEAATEKKHEHETETTGDEMPDADDSDIHNLDAESLTRESSLDDVDLDAPDSHDEHTHETHEHEHESATETQSAEKKVPKIDLSKLELVSKKAEDGRIITRYRSFDFIDSRSLFETYRNRRPIVGAAIVRERELIKVIGVVPKEEGRAQVDTLLYHSRQALEKPSLDFIASNEVLMSIHEHSIGQFKQRECTVVLFTEDDGKPSLLPLQNKMGRAQAKTPIFEFRSPKFVHDRFREEKQIIGASIIGEAAGSASNNAQSNRPGGKDRGRDNRDRNDRDRNDRDRDSFKSRNAAPKNLVVLAAFGRTPLKQNILLSPEILKRLGVDISIL